jgi:hypothetical protein
MRVTNSTLENYSWRTRAGLPPVQCPECGKDGRHWVGESLNRPGHYLCAEKLTSEPQGDALFDLDPS